MNENQEDKSTIPGADKPDNRPQDSLKVQLIDLGSVRRDTLGNAGGASDYPIAPGRDS